MSHGITDMLGWKQQRKFTLRVSALRNTWRIKNSQKGLTIVQKTLEATNIDFALENTLDGVLFWLDLP